MKIFIYVLTEPDGVTIRYVGKSNEFRISKRISEHCRYSQLHLHTHKNNWIKSLLEKNQKPILKVIEECHEENYRIREKYWVQFYKMQGCTLTNGTEGGEGAVRIRNRIISDEQKKTISQTLKKRYQEHPEMFENCSRAGKLSKGIKRNFKFQQTSKFVGVSFSCKNRDGIAYKWRSYSWDNGKQISHGEFYTEREAIDARQKYIDSHEAPHKAGLHDDCLKVYAATGAASTGVTVGSVTGATGVMSTTGTVTAGDGASKAAFTSS
jgi:hypothetical protein